MTKYNSYAVPGTPVSFIYRQVGQAEYVTIAEKAMRPAKAVLIPVDSISYFTWLHTQVLQFYALENSRGYLRLADKGDAASATYMSKSESYIVARVEFK